MKREESGDGVPDTKREFRAAVKRLRDDPQLAKRLGLNGLSAAKREYDWEMEGKRLIVLYDELEGERELRPGERSDHHITKAQ